LLRRSMFRQVMESRLPTSRRFNHPKLSHQFGGHFPENAQHTAIDPLT
jgi:hypothetical protein